MSVGGSVLPGVGSYVTGNFKECLETFVRGHVYSIVRYAGILTTIVQWVENLDKVKKVNYTWAYTCFVWTGKCGYSQRGALTLT